MNDVYKKLKICVITSWFPSASRPTIAPFVYRFVENLGKTGAEVSVIIPRTKGEKEITKEKFFTIYRIERNFLIQIYKLISKIKPDLIHVQAPNFFSANALITAKLKKIPLVGTVHRAEIDNIRFPISSFRKFALSRFDKIIAVSEFTKSLALKAGINKNKITIIYNSCDDALFVSRNKIDARKRLLLPLDLKIILFVGNLVRVKGIFTLVEACRFLHSSIQDFLVLIIGDGEERETLQTLVNSYNLTKQIKFVDWKHHNELAYYYNASDVFVLPSSTEGHSVALLEAMASGLPVIASNKGGNLESITNDINGLFFDANDPEILSMKIAKLISDQRLCEQMANNGIKMYHSRFSSEIQMKSHLKLYRSLLENN